MKRCGKHAWELGVSKVALDVRFGETVTIYVFMGRA